MLELPLSMGPMYSEEGIECFMDIVFSWQGKEGWKFFVRAHVCDVWTAHTL